MTTHGTMRVHLTALLVQAAVDPGVDITVGTRSGAVPARNAIASPRVWPATNETGRLHAQILEEIPYVRACMHSNFFALSESAEMVNPLNAISLQGARTTINIIRAFHKYLIFWQDQLQ